MCNDKCMRPFFVLPVHYTDIQIENLGWFLTFSHLPFIFRFMVGDLSDSESDLSSELVVKEIEFQGTEEAHKAFSHGTELIPW